MSGLAPHAGADPTKSLRVDVYERLERRAIERLETANRRDRRVTVVRQLATGTAIILVILGGVLLALGRVSEWSTLASVGTGVGILSATITHRWLVRHRMTAERQACIERDVWHSLLQRARLDEQAARMPPLAAPPEGHPDAGGWPPQLGCGSSEQRRRDGGGSGSNG